MGPSEPARGGWGLLLLALFVTGCSGDRPSSDGGPAVPAPAPKRVAVLAPAAAEMLVALELGDRVVGLGEFGPWPEEVSGLPAVGGYDSPNVERLLALSCDALITVSGRAGGGSRRRLEELGIRVVALDTSTYDGIHRSLALLGERFDRAAEAETLGDSLRQELDRVAAMAESAVRRRVLVVVGRDPLYVAGPGSHIDEMIARVGGTNVAHDALTPYQQLSIESVLERMPEVIIDVSDNRPGTVRGREAGEWGRWPFLPAVRDGRVWSVAPGRLTIPGIRLPEMTRLTGKLVHPEIFGEASDDELCDAGREAVVQAR